MFNVVPSGRSPEIADDELERLGFALAIYPLALLEPAAVAMAAALARMKPTAAVINTARNLTLADHPGLFQDGVVWKTAGVADPYPVESFRLQTWNSKGGYYVPMGVAPDGWSG